MRKNGDLTTEKLERIVGEFFQFVMQGKLKEGLRFFAAGCRQHSPYVQGGMDALLDAIAAMQEESPEYSDPDFSIKHIISKGDIVAAHTELLSSKSDPGKGGLRQVHIFRFGSDGKIVEYWDVTQVIQPDMPNAANAF